MILRQKCYINPLLPKAIEGYPIEQLSQSISIEWVGADVKPPKDTPLWGCFIHRQPVLPDDKVQCASMTMFDSLIFDGMGFSVFNEETNTRESCRHPDYWAIRKYPKPPIIF